MKNAMKPMAFKPAARTRQIESIGDVFREPAAEDDWVISSVRMRRGTRRRLKEYASRHDLKLQDVVQAAFDAYLDRNEHE